MYSELVTLPKKLKSLAQVHGERCLFRIPEHTGRVLWQLTNLCNYECVYCIFSSGAFKPFNELDMRTIKRVLGELYDADFRSIKFTGGEPFVRKDLIEILATASKLDIKFDLSTNASLITQECATALAATRPEMIHMSIDGSTPALHEALRGKNTFAKTIRGVERVVNTGVSTRIGCVVSALNEHELEQMVKFCIKLGVAEVIFSRLEPAGRLNGDATITAKKTNASLAQEVERLEKAYCPNIKVSHAFQVTRDSGCTTRPSQCPGGKRFLYIDNCGHIAPCTWAAEKDRSLLSTGTLSQSSLKELLREEPLQRFATITSTLVGCPVASLRGTS